MLIIFLIKTFLKIQIAKQGLNSWSNTKETTLVLNVLIRQKLTKKKKKSRKWVWRDGSVGKVPNLNSQHLKLKMVTYTSNPATKQGK